MWNQNLRLWFDSLHRCPAQLFPSLQLSSFQTEAWKYGSANNSRKAGVPASNTSQSSAQVCPPLLAAGRNTHPSAWGTCDGPPRSQPQKGTLFLRHLISLGFTPLCFCLCHTWPSDADGAAACASSVFLWETQENLHVLLLFKALWFLKRHFCDRLNSFWYIHDPFNYW